MRPFRRRTGLETAHPRAAALRRFAGEQPYRRIGVSTHGAMVRQLMKHALPPVAAAKTRNTVLYILRYEPPASASPSSKRSGPRSRRRVSPGRQNGDHP